MKIEKNKLKVDLPKFRAVVLVLLILGIQISFAEEDITTCFSTCALSSDYGGWIQVIAVVMLSVVSLLSLIYLVGRVMGRRDWEALSKAELYQTGIAVVWVIIIASVATTSCSVACQITGQDNPITAATSYLSSIKTTMDNGISQLFDYARNIRIKSAVALSIISVFVRPWSGCETVAGSYEQMAVVMSPFVGSVVAQLYALSFIQIFAFQFLLPIGLILRLIPFAREAGAALMAMAFALYIVFPLTYVMVDKMTTGMRPQEVAFKEIGRECVDPTIAAANLKMLGKFLPQAVFFPALSTIITIAAARTLTKVFRYDFQEITG